GNVLFSSSTRTGKLAGSFDFKTNASAGLPTDVKKTPIGVKVNRFISTNAKCPTGGGGGGGGGGNCQASRSFSGQIFLTSPTFSMTVIPTGKTSFLTFNETVNPAPKPARSISR